MKWPASASPPSPSGDADEGIPGHEVRPVYDAHAPFVFRAALRAALGDFKTAEDATQQAFLEALEHWPAFREASHAGQRSWLIQRACWRVRDSWRKTGAEYPSDDIPEPEADGEEYNTLAVIAADLFWKKIVTDVSPRAARAAYLAWNEEWPVTEIADFLGVSRRTVKRDLNEVLAAAMQPGRTTSLEGGEA